MLAASPPLQETLMIGTALALAEKGLAVFPCKPRDKRPATTHGLKDATRDAATIRHWWRQEPAFNIGIATGAVSKILVIDVDGLDAEAALRKLEAEHGALPATVESITARGRHIYFRCPQDPVRNSAGKIGTHIDVRGDGGYVLCPPSIHPSGRRYCWSVDSANSIAAAPGWLLDRITERSNGGSALPAPPAAWRDLVSAGATEGSRNDSLARLAGHLLRRHVDPVVAFELLTAWNATRCHPPLEAAEIATIVDSIAGRELKRRGAG
jgi:hypothetical protein